MTWVFKAYEFVLKAYSNFVLREIGKAEAICKVLKINSIEGPQGGTPPPPNFDQAFEEGKNRKGRNPRQKTVPHLSSCVLNVGSITKGVQEAWRLHNRAWRLQNRGWRLQNRGLEAPKSRPGGSKIEPRARQDAIVKDV